MTAYGSPPSGSIATDITLEMSGSEWMARGMRFVPWSWCRAPVRR